MSDDIYSQGKEIQKSIILARMTEILGNVSRATDWMNTLRPEFDDASGAWQTANELIDKGGYERVVAEVCRIDYGVY